jgi:hypothetical protein
LIYEDRPEKDTPDWIREDLAEYGGLSPTGKPIWRLILAQNRRIHYFGRQNFIAKGRTAHLMENAVQQEDGFGVNSPENLVPDRIAEGEFWFPRYHIQGWILERWFPASVWGTREKWEGEKAQDERTRLLAAYPQDGDYMMMPCGPWRSIAEAGDIKAAIRGYNVQQRQNPHNWQNWAEAVASFEESYRQELADQFADELEARHRLGISSILRTASPAAQEFRNLVAEKTAGGINFGASEKWG